MTAVGRQQTALQDLRTGFTGEVILPDDMGYDDARRCSGFRAVAAA